MPRVPHTDTASYEKWDDAFRANRIGHILRIACRHEALVCHDAHGRRGGHEEAKPSTQKRRVGRDARLRSSTALRPRFSVLHINGFALSRVARCSMPPTAGADSIYGVGQLTLS